jgi:hypothetical protein
LRPYQSIPPLGINRDVFRQEPISKTVTSAP